MTQPFDKSVEITFREALILDYFPFREDSYAVVLKSFWILSEDIELYEEDIRCVLFEGVTDVQFRDHPPFTPHGAFLNASFSASRITKSETLFLLSECPRLKITANTVNVVHDCEDILRSVQQRQGILNTHLNRAFQGR